MSITVQTDLATQSQWHALAQQLRVDSIRCSTKAGSGHPTSSMSAADLMAVLMSKYLHYDFANPDNPNNDHLIFSKGHASARFPPNPSSLVGPTLGWGPRCRSPSGPRRLCSSTGVTVSTGITVSERNDRSIG